MGSLSWSTSCRSTAPRAKSLASVYTRKGLDTSASWRTGAVNRADFRDSNATCLSLFHWKPCIFSGNLIKRFGNIRITWQESSEVVGEAKELPDLIDWLRYRSVTDRFQFFLIRGYGVTWNDVPKVKSFDCSKKAFRQFAVELMLPKSL